MVLQDGPGPLLDATREAIVEEATAMFGPLALESVVADYTQSGARTALARSLAHPELRGVLTLGPLTAQAAVASQDLAVPVVSLLGAPLGAHGLREEDPRPLLGRGTGLNFVGDLAQLRSLAPRIQQVRVVVTEDTLAALPDLSDYLARASATHGVKLSALKVSDGTLHTALDALDPAQTALYLGVPVNPASLSTQGLLDAARKRRLPVVSGLSTSDVHDGALLSVVPENGTTLRARQAILGMAALRDGEDLRHLRTESPVELAVAGASPDASMWLPFTLNGPVARELELEPSFAMLQSAEVVSHRSHKPSVTLASAVERALDSNRTLRAEHMRLQRNQAFVRRARAPLLPQVTANAQANWIDKDRAAGPFPPSERQISVGGTASQTIYSARQVGDHKVAKYDNVAVTHDYRGAQLDLVLEVAVRYIEVLRTRVVLRVAEQRVRSSRANLALAEGRNRAGDVARDEVFRWRVDLSESQQDAVRAAAGVRKAGANLNEVLSFSPERRVQPGERDGAALPMLATDPRLAQYFDSPTALAQLRSYAEHRTLEATPELAAAKARIEAEDRRRKQQLRTLLTPELALQASLTRRVWRDGAGSATVSVPGLIIPDNFDWSVGVVANVPLFEGLGQRAALDEATAVTQRVKAEKEALTFALARQVHNALEEASAAHQATALATEAAAASRENLILVRDAYARGAVDVIRLVDAQSQAFTTELGARNAYHDFLTAFVAVERLLGQFSFGPDAFSSDDFFRALARPSEPTARMEPKDASRAQQTN